MAKLTHSECFDREMQSAYVSGSLDVETSAALLRHMATCPACAAGVGRLLEETAEEEQWAARASGDAWRQRTVAVAVVAAMAGAAGEMKAALDRWARQGARVAHGRVRAVGRGRGEVFRWLFEGLEGRGPTPAPAGVRTRGVIRGRGGVSEHRPVETIEIPLGGGLSAHCAMEGNEVVVRFPPQFSAEAAPVVLIVPESGADPFAILAEKGEGGHYVARATAPEGEFEVTLSPVLT